MNIFETAARQKLRISSERGHLTVEQLWDLPLSSAKGISLDSIGRDIQRELREITEESLVETRPSPQKAMLTLILDVIKHIIATKQSENAAFQAAGKRTMERKKLLDILASKKDAELSEMTVEQINSRLLELDL